MLWAAFDRVLAGLPEPTPAAPALVACSGGLDSVVLLDVALDRLGAARVAIAHADHGVRPGSVDDAAFVAERAEALGVRLVSSRLAPAGRDEAALRSARYAFLEATRGELAAAFVLIGHHRDDLAETVLLQLIRHGRPSGMAEVRGPWVRPFLRVPRHHLQAHAGRRGLPYREDPSNQDPAYLRNRIRRELLPLIESRYRPGFGRRLAALGVTPAAGPVAEAPPTPAKSPADPAAAPPRVGWRRRPHRGETPPASPEVVWFDADAVPELELRPFRPGDRIQPFGMAGRKKLSDVFQEHRVPRRLRNQMPVLVAKDRVLWVPGLVRSAMAPIRPETRNRWEIWSKWE